MVPARRDRAGRRARGTSSGRRLSRTATNCTGTASCSAGRAGWARPPRVVGTRPLRFALPADAAGTPRRARCPGLHASEVRSQRRRRRHAQRADTGSASRSAMRFTARNGSEPSPVTSSMPIEPIAMFGAHRPGARVRSRSSHKSFLIFASIALALTAARRLNNAIVSWTDLMDLPTYSWLANVMWVPNGGRLDDGLEPMAPASVAQHRCVGCRAGDRRDRRRRDPCRECDQWQPARVHRPVCRDRRSELFVSGPMRILALVTLASIMPRSSAASCSIRSACRASGFRSASACRGRSTFTRSSFRSWRF